ncbi:UNVERIFIED_CONTAM: hypothetical protein RMT77_007633 [Armadillidium vulgare]
MLQNTLSSTLSFHKSNGHISTLAAGDGGTMQELENAGRLVDKHLNYDSCFPSLLDMMKLPPQGGASVSGLSENDYPSGGDSRLLRHLHTLRKVPLPADLLHHFQHMQCNCMMGLFPEIKRAWLTIDSDIYVWVYEDGSDLSYFDGLHDTILSVGLVTPKAGVFKPYIEHLLCLATPTEIVLLGVSFSYPGESESSPCMNLLPEPLFSVSTDGAYILTVKGSNDGRIFLGAKDGSLWELVYQAEDGWFSRKCYKVNYSRSTLSYILPSFLTLSDDDPVTQVEIDNSRYIVYTLTEKGNISIYDLGSDGKGMSKVMTVSHNSIMNMAVMVAKTVDKMNFKNLVSICPIDKTESPHIHLVVITGTGVRLYYSTTPLNMPHARPYQMNLLHIRLPPGFAANALTHRPTKVHKALYSHGTGILCASESNESDVIWTVSRDQFPYHPSLAESQAVLAVDGYVWALADVTPPLWCSTLNPPTPQGTSPPLLVTQHQQAPRQLVLLSASGAHILTALRPVDQLKHLLQECGGADSNIIKEFFLSMSLQQACATALILAMDPNLQETRIAEWAREAIFRYGTVHLPNVAFSTFQNFQSPVYPFLPTQVSTPVQGQIMPHQQQQHQQPPQGDQQQYSPLHNALFLYLARILRPVWATPFIKEEVIDNKPILTCVLSSEEVSFLARHVDLMAKFMLANQGPGQNISNISLQNTLQGTPNQTMGLTTCVGDGNLGERASLLALRSLLAHALEVLRLCTVLTTHNFSLVTEGLSKELRDQVRGVTLRDLILSGKDACRNLIMALMDRYHGDNASIDAISMRLRDVCPSLYRIEDAKLSKANEIILAAKNNDNKAEKEKAFREAVELCKQIGQYVNVVGICSQLASGGWYEGVVDLCLSIASQRDPSGQALHYYKNNEPSDDPQGFMAFSSRMECYRVIVDNLNQLIGSSTISPPLSPPNIPNRPGPPVTPQQTMPSSDAGHFAEQMITLIVNSSDELAHVTLYQWLVDTGRTDRLLAISTPYLENFFTKPNSKHPLENLLWRYYERNKEYYKAAKTLSQLADQSGDTLLSVRIEYLSRALMCLSSSQMTTATSYADFMLHLEEKKDVARVQLMILEAIQAKGGSSEVITSLNSGLLDITTLYEKYAEPWELWECKLAIVHCAGHSEHQLIRVLWTHIIDNELLLTESSPTSSRIDALAAKIKSLARLYSTSPNFFPLEHIIRTCEIRSVQLKTENSSWVVDALHDCGIPVSKLIAMYHRLYRSGDSVWEVERAPYHLLRILSHLFSMLTDSPVSVPSQERRALREECLDYIAEYLTDLGASADASAAIISSRLKTCQMKLEKS